MKNKPRAWLLVSALVLSVLVGLGCAIITMPLKYYDEQGVRIAAYLQSEGLEAYYSEHRYLSLTGWQKGVDISIYGLVDKEAISGLIEKIKAQNPTTNIWIEFYTGTHDGNNSMVTKRKIRQ